MYCHHWQVITNIVQLFPSFAVVSEIKDSRMRVRYERKLSTDLILNLELNACTRQ